MASERGLWNSTLGHLSPFGMLHRVENSINLGTPDVAYSLRRKPRAPAASGWLELKECSWPERATTRFSIPSLTLEQADFLRDWSKAGGRAFLLAQVDRDYLLWNGPTARSIFKKEWSPAEARGQARLVWQSPWPRAKILDVLAET